jgi:hypothetical protein
VDVSLAVCNRLAAIGLEAGDPAGVEVLVEGLMPSSRETIYRGGGSVFEWRDPSGAGLLVTTLTVDNIVKCVTPTFTAGSLVTAVPTGFGADDDCRFCEPLLADVLDDDGRLLTRLAVHLEDSAVTRRQVPLGRPITMAIAAFVDEARCWPDEGAYERDQRQSRTPFASRSLVPVGLFGDRPRPHAIVTGIVSRTDVRDNETTSRPFRWLRVDTLGMSLETVSAVDTLPDVEPGTVIQAVCWMVGRVVNGLAEPTLREKLKRSREARASGR